LALSERNQLEVLPGFAGSKFDEMTIDYIKTIPSYYGGFTWDAGNPPAADLFTVNLSPSNFVNNQNDAGNTILSPTPVAWLSTMFGLYRGSFVVRFKFVKTAFHSGRLQFTFVPFDHRFSTPALLPIGLFEYANRQIVDIKEGNEFTVAIPYTANQNYLPVNAPYGILRVTVVDPLRATATVSSSVPVLVEAWGGADLEFAQPKALQFEPYLPTSPQSGDPCNLDYETIGGTAIVNDDIFARTCVGEKILTLRSLIKGAVPLTNYDHSVQTGNNWTFYPFTLQAAIGLTPTGVQHPYQRVDFLSYIASPFSTFRGSMRFYGDVSADVKWKARSNYGYLPIISPVYTAATIAPPDARAFLEGQPVAIGNTQKDGGINVSIPYYNKFHSTPVAEAFYSATSDPGVTRVHLPNQIVTVATSAVTDITFSRFAGDDFSFGGFVSIFPLIASGSSRTA
jgi:hypothetical protein